jgi:hypothetical protein
MASLIVRQGTQAGMSFPVAGNQVTIGREEGLDIVLQDPEASRRHSRISWQGGMFVVEDLGSTNGTFVNGVQITSPQVLNPGDSIGIGQTILVFQMVGTPRGGAAVYQAPQPAQIPAYSPPASAGRDGKMTQYLLYGCGCLLLVCICGLLAIATWALLDPASFENATGLDISYRVIDHYLNLA